MVSSASSTKSQLPRILWLLLSLAELAWAQTITCPDGSTGYGDIVGLNQDIRAEVQRIQQGGSAKLLYLYRLCPGVEIIMTEPLLPKLDGSIFRCGNAGLPADDCQFSGGDAQVIVNPSEIASLPLQDVRFEGVTFTGFSESAISGDATYQTTVTLEEVQFVAFDATFAVKQSNSIEGVAPFSVDMFGGSVAGAGGMGSVFSNDGGSLSIEQVSVVESNDVMALVATGGQGATIARDITVTGGTIGDVFSVVGGGTLVASGISIQDMTFIQNGFEIQGSNSRATITSSNFMMNTRLAPAQKWQGIAVLDGGIATVSSTAFVNNHQMLAVLSAVGDGASLQADDISIESVSGTTKDDTVTAAGVIYANANGQITLSRTTINNPRSFTSYIFSNQGSNVTVRQSCFEAGRVDAIVYQSEESSVTSVGNFIDNGGVKSAICQQPGQRAAIENPGSNCFEGGTPCEWKCTQFATAGECLASSSLQPGFQAPFNGTTLPPNGTLTLPPLPTNETAAPLPDGNGTVTPSPAQNVTAAPTLLVPGNATGPPGNVSLPTSVPTLLQATAPPGTSPTIATNGTLPPGGNATAPPSTGGGNATLPPAGNATTIPTLAPGSNATVAPGGNGTTTPSVAPGNATAEPGNGTLTPSIAPGNATAIPGNGTTTPSVAPGNATAIPGNGTTSSPTIAPEGNATAVPSGNGTTFPTVAPGNFTTPPVGNATVFPTLAPGNGTTFPTLSPVNATIAPNTTAPTFIPANDTFPTMTPTVLTAAPTNIPTVSPAPTTTTKPTPSEPTLSPVVPSPSPTITPTITPVPTATPSAGPSSPPSISQQPSLSSRPSNPPSVSFTPTTSEPSATPTSTPSFGPSATPTVTPPSGKPSSQPSVAPSALPSATPTTQPSVPPTQSPAPSMLPTGVPSFVPSTAVPSFRPSAAPTGKPTSSMISAPPADTPAGPGGPPNNCNCRYYWFANNPYYNGYDPINYGGKGSSSFSDAMSPRQDSLPVVNANEQIIQLPNGGHRRRRRRARAWPRDEESTHHRLKGATGPHAQGARRLKGSKGYSGSGSTGKGYSSKGQILHPPLPQYPMPQYPMPQYPVPHYPVTHYPVPAPTSSPVSSGGESDPCWYYCKWLSYQEDLNNPGNPDVGQQPPASPPDGGYNGPQKDDDASFFH